MRLGKTELVLYPSRKRNITGYSTTMVHASSDLEISQSVLDPHQKKIFLLLATVQSVLLLYFIEPRINSIRTQLWQKQIFLLQPKEFFFIFQSDLFSVAIRNYIQADDIFAFIRLLCFVYLKNYQS